MYDGYFLFWLSICSEVIIMVLLNKTKKEKKYSNEHSNITFFFNTGNNPDRTENRHTTRV